MIPTKFKAWAIQDKKMYTHEDVDFKLSLDGHLYENGWASECGDYECCAPIEIETKHDGVIILQFTGLHDKNKKEIYSGYIVDFIYLDEKYRSEVKFYNGAFCVEWPLGRLLLSEVSDLEAVGNIYQNPELLSKKSLQ